jgi:hypothetical protein
MVIIQRVAVGLDIIVAIRRVAVGADLIVAGTLDIVGISAIFLIVRGDIFSTRAAGTNTLS